MTELMSDAEIEAARAAARERGMNCIMAQDDADELAADVAELAILRRRAAIAADVIDGLNQTALRLTTERDEAMRLAADIDKDRGRLAERTKELDEELHIANRERADLRTELTAALAYLKGFREFLKDKETAARTGALKEAEKKMTEMATSCDVVGDPDADVFRCAAEAIAAAAVKPGEPNVGAPIPDLTGGEGGAPDENVE